MFLFMPIIQFEPAFSFFGSFIIHVAVKRMYNGMVI